MLWAAKIAFVIREPVLGIKQGRLLIRFRGEHDRAGDESSARCCQLTPAWCAMDPNKAYRPATWFREMC
jgi:hypothetical protein